MPDTVLNALRNKLARYEADGEPDRVKRVKARIAELEKAPQGEAPQLAMTLSVPATGAPAVLGATVSTTPKPTVKKASAKKSGARKKK